MGICGDQMDLKDKIKETLDKLSPECTEILRMYEFNPEWTIEQIEGAVIRNDAYDSIGSIIAIYESDLQHEFKTSSSSNYFENTMGLEMGSRSMSFDIREFWIVIKERLMKHNLFLKIYLGCFSFCCCFVPWIAFRPYDNIKLPLSLKYSFLWAPPTGYYRYSVVDLNRLILELFALTGVFSILFLSLNSKNK